MSKFYKTVVTVEILSEDPVPSWMNLDNIYYEITDGNWSGQVNIGHSEEMDAKTMAQLLLDQGSDPGFFNLDSEGKKI